MNKKHQVHITARDRVFQGWEASMELVRNYEAYAGEIGDGQVSRMFQEFAEDEGVHAAKFLETLHAYEEQKGGLC